MAKERKRKEPAAPYGLPLEPICVSNISAHKEKVFDTEYGKLEYHCLVADRECGGKKQEQASFVLYDDGWASVQEHGCYFG